MPSYTVSKTDLISQVPDNPEAKRGGWRVLTGFWLLGVCNNFGYVVMLSAAHDLLSDGPSHNATNPRHCNTLSTGAILLADILPAVVVKAVLPFFPLWMTARMLVMLGCSLAGYVLVAGTWTRWLMLCGVALTSLSSGVGESSLLAYMPSFGTSNVISAWSSGTGGAGVLGALSYAGLTALGVSSSTTIYCMISVPIVMGLVFWVLLVHPKTSDRDVHDLDNVGLSRKLNVIRNVTVTYMIPFALVYIFEYFINQGLTELINYDNMFLNAAAQYRWFALDYQIGVLISRSSVNIIQVDNTWLLALLQGINVVVMTTEAVYRWIGNFWLVLVIVFWEGLLGGCSYVNTFRRINTEVVPEDRQFAMSVCALGDSLGITISGFISIPVHNAICILPAP